MPHHSVSADLLSLFLDLELDKNRTVLRHFAQIYQWQPVSLDKCCTILTGPMEGWIFTSGGTWYSLILLLQWYGLGRNPVPRLLDYCSLNLFHNTFHENLSFKNLLRGSANEYRSLGAIIKYLQKCPGLSWNKLLNSGMCQFPDLNCCTTGYVSFQI
jgi:hypothetical protein